MQHIICIFLWLWGRVLCFRGKLPRQVVTCKDMPVTVSKWAWMVRVDGNHCNFRAIRDSWEWKTTQSAHALTHFVFPFWKKTDLVEAVGLGHRIEGIFLLWHYHFQKAFNFFSRLAWVVWKCVYLKKWLLLEKLMSFN